MHTLSEKLRFLFGNKQLYRQTAAIVLPIIIQNTVTNVVSLLDNVMVGQVGTLQMSAVAIVNQLMFVFNLCIFGAMAGPGIFSTQYAGAGDVHGVRSCFRLKLWLAALLSAAAVAVFTLLPEPLLRLYLSETGPEAEAVLGYGRDYLSIMILGTIPFAAANAYAMTLRETGETRLPMMASIAAILVNLVLNWVLIFGNLGFPAMGVRGAAIATVISRFAELTILVTLTHLRRYPFIRGAWKSLAVEPSLVRRVAIKGAPLMINEFLWSSGMAAMMACYATRGIGAVAACNIASTVNNLFNVVFLSMGNAVAIMVGQALGSGQSKKAMDLSWQLMAMTVVSSLFFGGIMLLLAPVIPSIYNTEPSVRAVASDLLRVLALMMPIFSVPHCCYFTLRAGGRTMITFLFDSVFTWCVSCLCAFILSHYTMLPIVAVYALVQSMDLLKGVIGVLLVKRGTWIRNIVA